MNNELFYGAKCSILENKVDLYELTKNKNVKYLEDFINNYEWVVLEDTNNVGKYVIYDLQCGCIVEENYTLREIIDRVVGRALDYETDEHYDIFFEDFDNYNCKGYIDYINGLYKIAQEYCNEECWLLSVGQRVREMTRFFEDINK